MRAKDRLVSIPPAVPKPDAKVTPAHAPRVPAPPKLLSPHMILATLLVYGGIVCAGGTLGLSPTLYIAGKVPLIFCLAAAPLILVLGAWTLLRQNFSLRALFCWVGVSVFLLTAAHYRVRYLQYEQSFAGPMVPVLPSKMEISDMQRDTRPEALAALFDPVFMPEGFEPGFGTESLEWRWHCYAYSDGTGCANWQVTWNYYPARHPHPEQPWPALQAYARLKVELLPLQHALSEEADSTTGDRSRTILDYALGTKAGAAKNVTANARECLASFRQRLKDAGQDPALFLKALAEREPDRFLREVAAAEAP